jgi:type 1 glutamine amidotransferase
MKLSIPVLAAALMAALPAAAKVNVLIVTGGHDYDKAAFDAMWNSFAPEVEWTVRPLQYGHEVFEDVSAWPYDVLVFYNHQNPGARLTERHKANFRALLERGVGMLVLHHSVAAYPFFPEFEAMAGAKYRSSAYYKDTLSTYKIPVDIPCLLAERTHPLAEGLPASFTVQDEMYFKMAFAPDNRVLLSTTYPEADGPLAWTRTAGNSRVFTTILGNGSGIFANADFRAVVRRGLEWIEPCSEGDARPVCAPPVSQPKRLLIFHKQNGYIHASTDSCVAALKAHLAAQGLPSESTTDSLAFTAANLARFGAVMFYNTNYRNGPLLARAQEAAFEDFIHSGGGFVGVHSAVPLNGAAEEAVWPWYARLFGARFKSHPPLRSAPMVIEDPNHPSTRGLPSRFTLRDEWYAVQANPRSVAGLKVLATVDETGFPAGSGMGDHPMSWYRTFEGARTFVTLAGHDMASFSHPDFLRHLAGGILWAGSWDGTTASRPASAFAARPSAGTAAGRERGRIGFYRGKDGTVLEVRGADGRFIEARRSGPSGGER